MNALISRARSATPLPLMLIAGLLALLSLSPSASAQVRRWLQPDSVPPLKRSDNAATFHHAVAGQQAVFYPFAQSPSSWCRFASIEAHPKGRLDSNSFMLGLREVIYDADNTSAGDLILSGVRYFDAEAGSNTPIERYDYLINTQLDERLPLSHTQYLTVTGHLFEQLSNVPANTAVLQLHVLYLINSGQSYRLGSDAPKQSHRAQSDTAIVYAVITVPKDSLLPQTPAFAFTSYRTVSFPFSLDTICGGMPAPAICYGEATHHFDVRVYWTGAEKLALRSIAIRDSIGELLLGSSPQSVSYRRDTLYNDARRLVAETEAANDLRLSSQLLAGELPAGQSFAACAAVVEAMLHVAEAEYTLSNRSRRDGTIDAVEQSSLHNPESINHAR